MFDSALWKSADSIGDAKCSMLADLRFRIGVEGKSRDELTEMLGEPEDKDSDPKTTAWLLCPSFADIWILEVRWKDDRVAEARVRDT